jgi:hypothetical protein
MKMKTSLNSLSPEALQAMKELLAGLICSPSEAVVQELGKAGLAYRRNLRSRSRRLNLTTKGAKYMA